MLGSLLKMLSHMFKATSEQYTSATSAVHLAPTYTVLGIRVSAPSYPKYTVIFICGWEIEYHASRMWQDVC